MIWSCIQWRSQALKSGWAQRVWGPQRGPRAEPRSGAEPPEARYIQTVCSCQMLFYAGLLPSPPSIPPVPPKKLRICANPMTQHGRGRVGTSRAHSWLRYCLYFPALRFGPSFSRFCIFSRPVVVMPSVPFATCSLQRVLFHSISTTVGVSR